LKINIQKTLEFKKNIQKSILDISLVAGAKSAHIGGALSSVDLFSVLLNGIANFNSSNFKEDSRDRIILSKGHACLVLYASLIELGIIKKNQLKNFEGDNSDFAGHPIRNKNFGIEFSSGSLGMGLSYAVGLSIAFKRKKMNNKVFAIIGDGECNEGVVWEAIMSINHFNLNNLIILVDKNNFQQTGSINDIMKNESLARKFNSFGINSVEIDGHDHKIIFEKLKESISSQKPSAIIAKTTKGHGFKLFENNNNWHHAILTSEIYKKLIEEIN